MRSSNRKRKDVLSLNSDSCPVPAIMASRPAGLNHRRSTCDAWGHSLQPHSTHLNPRKCSPRGEEGRDGSSCWGGRLKDDRKGWSFSCVCQVRNDTLVIPKRLEIIVEKNSTILHTWAAITSSHFSVLSALSCVQFFGAKVWLRTSCGPKIVLQSSLLCNRINWLIYINSVSYQCSCFAPLLNPLEFCKCKELKM